MEVMCFSKKGRGKSGRIIWKGSRMRKMINDVIMTWKLML